MGLQDWPSVLTRSGDIPHPAPVQAGGLLLDRHQPGHCSWWGGWGELGVEARGARFGKGCSHGMGTDHFEEKE